MVTDHKYNILKKTAAVILLITVSVFFGINVYATTYNPTTYNTFSDSITVSDVTYSLRVTQFKALSTGTSMLPSGMETIMFVVFQLTNDNNQDALCQVPQFNIDLSDQRVITDVYTYAGDLALGITSNGFIILPTANYSYDASNKIVVPANSTLTLVGGIGLPAQLNQTGDGTLDTGLRNVHLLYKPYTVTLGDYYNGAVFDTSSIVDAIDELIDTVSTTDEMLEVIDLLTSINSSVSYTGTAPSINIPDVHRNDLVTMLTSENLYIFGRRLIPYPTVINTDMVMNTTSDSTYTETDFYYDVDYLFVFNARKTNGVVVNYQNLELSIPNVGYVSTNVIDLQSNVFEIYDITTQNSKLKITTYPKYLASTGRYIALPYGYSYLKFTVRYMFRNTSSITVQTFDSNVLMKDYTVNGIGDGNIGLTRDANINEIKNTLNDLYNAYSQVNGLDDSSDISNDVADVSDSNHIIEESYYSANASAIEATGLRNYRFSNEQNNGIGKVADDFMLLWNALGSWSGVYIFSLTMALATFIMRHGGLFTIKRETSDKGGEGE